jgi:hypothetical protein
MGDKTQTDCGVNILTKMVKNNFKVNVLTGRKSQITLFMILGIIILFAFAFLYFGVSSTAKTRITTQVSKQAGDILNERTTMYYTHLCLESILKEGVILMGRQGGYILPNQPGSVIPQGYIEFNAERIPYLIKPVPYPAPQYPCFSAANPPVYCGFTNNKQIYPQLLSIVYGTNLLPYLEKYQGRYSIQEQLESYISAEAVKCLPDLTTIAQFSNYQITPGDIKAEVDFTPSTIAAKVDYPVIISIPGIDEPASASSHVKATVFARFRQLYESAKEIIQYDNNFLDYNIVVDTNTGNYEGRVLRFNALDNVTFTPQLGVAEDVFMLNDSASIIDGKPLVFQFARKNRYPALDYIPEGKPAEFFEFVHFENETITIKPNASDPDEDNIAYSYKGWKADYDSIWNDAARAQQIIPTTQNYWETSDLFQDTGRESEILLSHNDIGIHNITVYANDSNLADYQSIRILVDAFLKAEFMGNNLYSDIDDSHASIEDPYLLNVTSKTILVDPTTRYIYTWIASFEGLLKNKGEISCLQLPTKTQCFEVDASIDNMIGPFSIYSAEPETIGLIVEAYGLTNQSASAHYNITVHECLPHRNAASLPYPFHNTDNPFQADHTCCSLDYKIQTGKECIRYEEFTCYPTVLQSEGILDKAVEERAGNPATLWPAEVTPIITAHRQDSIYLRTFTQLCGNRGNACSGNITDEWKLYKRCNPDESSGIDEHCQGPSRNKSCEINQDSPACYNYDSGESFEKTFLEQPGATGICNKQRACSPVNAWRGGGAARGVYGKGGPLSCQAQCSRDGSCSYAFNCVCSAGCDNESVALECDNKAPGYSENGLGFSDLVNALLGKEKNEFGCNFNCQWQDCGQYVFDPITSACATKESAKSDADCDDGHNYNLETGECE